VLAERSDAPKALAGVVARAMEKRPEDRYESAADLVEDFTIAAGMEPAGVSSAMSSGRLETSAPQQISEEDVDEETLVRRRVTRPMAPPAVGEMPSVAPSVVTPQSVQPSASSFNPWKVLIPAMIGLLVIFGVIYAFSRNSQPTTATTPSSSPLVADPNSSPVEPAKPPTGASESGIPAGGSTNQAANANTNTNTSTPESSDSPNDVGVDPTANENTNENTNTKKPSTLPLPSPTRSVDPGLPPAAPSATKPPLPKPTVPAASASPPELPQPN
jgi:serine/threonine-protein kinase